MSNRVLSINQYSKNLKKKVFLEERCAVLNTVRSSNCVRTVLLVEQCKSTYLSNKKKSKFGSVFGNLFLQRKQFTFSFKIMNHHTWLESYYDHNRNHNNFKNESSNFRTL